MPRRKKIQATEDPRPATLIEAEQDRDIAEDFAARQRLAKGGSEELEDKLREHHALSPELAAGDVDAAWELGRMSGEDTFTGHAPTPDHDRVDDLGAAAGLTYKDDEALGYDKVARRDERRWELDPRSSQDEDPATSAAEADTDDGNAPLRFWDLADDLDAEVDEEDDEDEAEDEDDEEDEAEEVEEEEVGLLEDEADLDEDDEEADDDLDEDLEDLEALDEDEDEDEDDD